MKILPASDSSLMVVLGDDVSVQTHRRVMDLFDAVRGIADPRIRNVHPAYASVLIDFDPLRLSHDEGAAIVRKIAGSSKPASGRATNVVTIPVCYDAEFAPDLSEVARLANLPPEQVIRLHESATYVVYFLGFSPGYPYLGGLPEPLHVPRLATPRTRVPAGTVAIAGRQAGIYPVESPGGWRLLGRTPVRMFDPRRTPATLVEPGDTVKFAAIDRRSFDRIAAESPAK